MSTFDQLLAAAKQADSNTPLQFSVSWCQGRTAFGGLSAGMLIAAMQSKVDSNRRLLSISTNFVGPLLADTPFFIAIEVLREGKSATQLLARAIQNGQTCVISQGCFAEARDSAIKVDVSKRCQLGPVQPERILPYQPGVMPEFFQHVALNPQHGALPFSNATSSHLGGWMRFKTSGENMHEAHVAALTDAWPPTLLQMFAAPAPASSMSWYIEFIDQIDIAADAWLGLEAITHHSANGYGLEDANIWSQDGRLLAISRQTVAIFA
ncbi:acyl-CoA thioesterase [Pseudoalteromonas fenneropenaei]|uniref:Acyl-CoA thioesterase n=1 Tax=Pseudoalteromonas fenneropenaei TaxID=1737459 RepID=A0ABV7CMH6_9GAMM